MNKLPYKCLYIIKHNSTALVKIGITNNWYERAKALQVGAKTSPLAVVLTDTNKEAESALHEHYRDYRLPGSEYFQLDKQALSEAVSAAFKYGKPLSDWRRPFKPDCPARALLQQDYVEVTAAFHRQLRRQMRLRYKTRINCILEHMNWAWDKESTKKFTAYLHAHTSRIRAKIPAMSHAEDWYVRLEVCEHYLDRLFTQLRVFVPQTLGTYMDPDFTLFPSLCFTTVKNNRIIKYEALPLFARIIFERLWHEYDFYSDFRTIQDRRRTSDQRWFEFYLESYGPYHYTVDKPLPEPVFAGKLNLGKSI